MKPSERGAVPKKLIAIQLAVLASLAAFYFFYLPYRTKSRASAEAQERELKIEALFQSLVVEDTREEVELPGSGGKVRVHPQRLNRMPVVDEVVQALGLPDRRTADFRGGLHITWTGTAHSLEAAFDRGRLYCLRREDLRTGHGALVFESSVAWHPF
ncbi:MAG TPA: hypothetical protein VEO19_11015 [Terriglobia bacterium]|nr:hypothetical protein [Terriglobia bacterium]